MLPAGAARRPPATSLVAVNCVVVVLPFVPVMQTQEGMPRRISGRHDDQIRVESRQSRWHRVVRLDERGADHLEQFTVLLAGRTRDHEHLGPEFDQGVGDREARHAEAEHGDPQAGPVGAPTGERGEIARVGSRGSRCGRHDQRLTHSR